MQLSPADRFHDPGHQGRHMLGHQAQAQLGPEGAVTATLGAFFRDQAVLDLKTPELFWAERHCIALVLGFSCSNVCEVIPFKEIMVRHP
jgi:hypothetical protein